MSKHEGGELARDPRPCRGVSTGAETGLGPGSEHDLKGPKLSTTHPVGVHTKFMAPTRQITRKLIPGAAIQIARITERGFLTRSRYTRAMIQASGMAKIRFATIKVTFRTFPATGHGSN